jgi:hypothetical protein
MECEKMHGMNNIELSFPYFLQTSAGTLTYIECNLFVLHNLQPTLACNPLIRHQAIVWAPGTFPRQIRNKYIITQFQQTNLLFSYLCPSRPIILSIEAFPLKFLIYTLPITKTTKDRSIQLYFIRTTCSGSLDPSVSAYRL